LSLSSRVQSSIIVKQKNGGTQHSAPFVLNCMSQLLQRFTIYCCVLGQKFHQEKSCLSQNTVHMIFLVENICLNLFLFGEPVCFQCKDCCLHSGVIWDTPMPHLLSQYGSTCHLLPCNSASEMSKHMQHAVFCASL